MKKSTLKIFINLFGLSLIGGSWLWLGSMPLQAQSNPLFPPEMNAARLAKTEFVIGDLGGVPVKIPHYFANYVEYDGDPSFGEKRAGAVPPRTYHSKLMSFGFKVRFPDMAGRSSPELWKDFEKYSDYNWKDYYDPIKSITPWVSVGITSGSHYSGDGFLDRLTKATLSFRTGVGTESLQYMEYEKVSKPEHSLTVYAPSGIDPKTKESYRVHSEKAEDLFIDLDSTGKVRAYITCRNRRAIEIKWASCTHRFSMESQMKTEIDVRYNRKLLPHWRQIQKNVSQLVWNFKTDEVTSTPPITPSTLNVKP